MSRFVPFSVWLLFLTPCLSANAETPTTAELGNAVVAIYLENYETKTHANPVIVVSDGTSMEIVTAIARTLTKLEYSDAKLCVSNDASSDYYLDIRMGVVITDGRAELFVGTDFPLSFANGLTDSLSESGVKNVRLRTARDFALWAEDDAPVSNSSDPFAGSSTKKIRKQDDPFNS